MYLSGFLWGLNKIEFREVFVKHSPGQMEVLFTCKAQVLLLLGLIISGNLVQKNYGIILFYFKSVIDFSIHLFDQRIFFGSKQHSEGRSFRFKKSSRKETGAKASSGVDQRQCFGGTWSMRGKSETASSFKDEFDHLGHLPWLAIFLLRVSLALP